MLNLREEQRGTLGRSGRPRAPAQARRRVPEPNPLPAPRSLSHSGNKTRILNIERGVGGGEVAYSVDSAFIKCIYEEIQTRVAGLQILFLAGEIGEECVIYGRTHGGPGPSGSALRILRWVPGAFSAGYWILADLRGLACFARCSLWSLLGLNFARGARGGGGAF